MPDAVVFPSSLLRERSGGWSLKATTVSPGQSATGAFSVARIDGGGAWVTELGGVNLKTKTHVKLWRALENLADGGVEPVVVPMCDKRHFPAPIVDGEPVYSEDPIPHDDDTFFDDGSGYAQSVVEASVTTSAALRATSLSLTPTSMGDLEGGEYFSINHPVQGWRLYRIGTAVLSGGVYAVTIRPPLREAVMAGTRLEFDRPRCTMRLASGDSMNLSLDSRRFANPSVSFVEYFYPA